MMMENTNLNIPNVKVGDLADILAALYINVIQSGGLLSRAPTPFLWGPPGIGKSESVRQIAEKIEQKTGKRVNIIDVRLLLMTPVDARGIPTANENRTQAVWLKPAIFQMEDSPDVVNILFLDELSAAPQSMQAVAYQLCLDRKVGEHRLPDNCIVMAAGNRTIDQSVSYKMPKALCNRLMHFNVENGYLSWFQWAIAHNIDSRIIGYLAFDNSQLCVEPESSALAYTTPRSWSYVDFLLKHNPDDMELLHPLISACVGTNTALEFETWIKTHTEMPKVEDVLKGRSTQYPKTHDVRLAFMASLVTAIRSRREQITAFELENACAYMKAARYPTDFIMTFYADLNEVEELRLKLMKCPSCQAWHAKNK